MLITLPVATGSWKHSHQWICLLKNKVSDRTLWLKRSRVRSTQDCAEGQLLPPCLVLCSRAGRVWEAGNVHSLHRNPRHAMLNHKLQKSAEFSFKSRRSVCVKHGAVFPLSGCRRLTHTVGAAVAARERATHRLNEAAFRSTWIDSTKLPYTFRPLLFLLSVLLDVN